MFPSDVQILHIVISFGKVLFFVSHFQLHTIVDSVCVAHANRNKITLVFIINYVRYTQVHSSNDVPIDPWRCAAATRGTDGCDILLCLATLCIVLHIFMILGVGQYANECDGKLREVDTSSLAFVRTLYIRLHDTSLRKWRPASASAHLH